MAQQLYAKIKRSSKYYAQNSWAEQSDRWGGFPFEIEICPRYGEYVVQGGPGEQYRLSDVNLFIKDKDGKPFRIA